MPVNTQKELKLILDNTFDVQTKNYSLILTKQKHIKKYSIDEALPAFQTHKNIDELDWGKPQGKEVW